MNIDTFQKVHETAHELAYGAPSVREWMQSEDTDSLLALAFQAGKLNYQVENGGFGQYFDNGYADGGDSGMWGSDISKVGMECHHKLIELLSVFKDQIATTSEEELLFNNIMTTLVDFTQGVWVDEEEEYEEPCDNCDGSGYIEASDVNDEDEFEEIECPECDRGYVMEYNEGYGYVGSDVQLKWDRLSSQYYQFNNEWMEMLDRFFQKAVEERPELIDN